MDVIVAAVVGAGASAVLRARVHVVQVDRLMRFIIPSCHGTGSSRRRPDRNDPLSCVPPETRVTSWRWRPSRRTASSTVAFAHGPTTLLFWLDQRPAVAADVHPVLGVRVERQRVLIDVMPVPRAQLALPLCDSISGTPAENTWLASSGSTHSRPNHQANPPSAASRAGSPVNGRVQVTPASFETKKPVRLPMRSLVIAYAGWDRSCRTRRRSGRVRSPRSAAAPSVRVRSPPSVDR
jgi:hypothetical protein